MRYIGLIFCAFIFLSCLNDRNSPLADHPNVTDTIKVIVPPKPAVDCSPDTVYFKQTILPLVTSNCAKSGCHDAISHKEGVVLTDYSNIMREVKVSSPASSDLYKCLNKTGDERMPPAPAAEFSLSNKALLLKWIQQGAKNNSCSNTANCDTVNVTYNASIAPILKTYCVGCHSATSPSAGVDLSTFTGVKVQAANGRLIGSITHAVGYKPMPSSTSKLGSCEINQIQVWITKGTLNN